MEMLSKCVDGIGSKWRNRETSSLFYLMIMEFIFHNDSIIGYDIVRWHKIMVYNKRAEHNHCQY